ncbi:hypothetical protein LTR86_003584 [Recurvomyces mirabilis]|nr:hypothetical protein LTR86_003584 [Recurvomyces mirabilis]
MRFINFLAIFATYCGFAATASAPPWGSHTLQGWWNPQSSNGQAPATTLKGYDYVVVGTGAGGAPLAARLGLAGFRVLVIEAGDDEVAKGDWNTTVPYFNAKASEDEKLSWAFYVDHYQDATRKAADPKYNYQLSNGSSYTGLHPPADAKPLGLLYPRTAALGGCVNHNALIMMYPLDDDWTQIANLTGDSSWNATGMRKYFERLENCQYLSPGTPGHGFSGWLATNRADPSIFLDSDHKVFPMMQAAANLSGQTINTAAQLTQSLLRDLNTGSIEYATEQGVYNAPLNMDNYKRSSPRDFLVNTASEVNAGSKGRIDIRLNCLVTRVVFAPGTKRAIGVEFLDGSSLYRADPRASPTAENGASGVAFASKEVILAGGAYNTPQILKLSGIGPAAELQQFGIPVLLDAPGVGQNLQDRIDNSVIANASEPWTVFKGCTSGVNASDPCLVAWNTEKSNKTKYATNGRPAHIPLRSSGAPNGNNDLIVTGRPGYFGGYFHGYSTIGSKFPNSWTWPVLKAHTTNRAGTVTLRSADPRDVPSIQFNYFDAGSGNSSYDLNAVVEGIKFARSIFAKFSALTNTSTSEIVPGAAYRTDDDLRRWVLNTSWGHHASCSCPIGADGDPMAVLDGQFRVRGTQGLRVVDASVFPVIPGFYIQSSIYVVSEKAADVIVADSGNFGSWSAPRGGWK